MIRNGLVDVPRCKIEEMQPASNLYERQQADTPTDWNRYYEHPPALARLTRLYTRSVLLRFLRLYAVPLRNGVIVELGGGNSFFAEQIIRSFSPREYHVVDTNRAGLHLLQKRASGLPLILHLDNILSMAFHIEADAVFSIGLIEHFPESERRDAILAHVRAVRKGGCVIISFPIPTMPYRITRALAERSGSWMFHDETPIPSTEVVKELTDHADIVDQHTLWPVVLTQHMIVALRK